MQMKRARHHLAPGQKRGRLTAVSLDHVRGGNSTPRTREYNSWSQMKARCNNKNNPAYGHYGGRGISVCRRWSNSFENFLSDMGGCPVGMTLDRINTNGHYRPSNCRWATRRQQQNNTRRNHRITHKGQTYSMAEWTRRMGFKKSILSARIGRRWPRSRWFEPAGPYRRAK